MGANTRLSPETWRCRDCGGVDLSFDRSLCACGRATTVRAALHSWKGYGPPYSREQDSENKRQALAAFDAAESERAELAREVEELRGALRRISERMPPGTINETCGSIARAALSKPTEGE